MVIAASSPELPSAGGLAENRCAQQSRSPSTQMQEALLEDLRVLPEHLRAGQRRRARGATAAVLKLLTERMTGIGKPDQKWWDRIFFAAAQVAFLAWLITMPLGAARFHWSSMPLALQILGALLLVGSFFLLFLTFKANPYLSPAVRIQRERGQAVIDSGPYRFVRHPMYAGAMLLIVGTSL
jgi:Phospholipid methyltransferase